MIVPDTSLLIPLDQPREAADFLNRFVLSDKTLFPEVPGSRKIVQAFNKMIEKAYRSRQMPRRFLRMTVMENGVHVFWNGREIEGEWHHRHAKEILLFLILNRGTVKRDILIDAFSPDSAINRQGIIYVSS
ncbi:hypothetical protein EWH99_05795 [Sporolactobacillus sp. THM7-7]|nr:hypothetical protein EWH99_05795 [Sporolactobacillus sp. THM7-7]